MLAGFRTSYSASCFELKTLYNSAWQQSPAQSLGSPAARRWALTRLADGLPSDSVRRRLAWQGNGNFRTNYPPLPRAPMRRIPAHPHPRSFLVCSCSMHVFTRGGGGGGGGRGGLPYETVGDARREFLF